MQLIGYETEAHLELLSSILVVYAALIRLMAVKHRKFHDLDYKINVNLY